ncbi:MAG: hypothetical protein V2J10_00185 [Wenzhouxiangella sp.]|nr:hypothetical protein [Wenzhouxiangella sp.]
MRIPDIGLGDLAVGKDLQSWARVELEVPPSEPVELVLAVADPAIAVISEEPTAVGAESIIWSVNNSSSRVFYVQGLSRGATTITASATGFNDSEATVTVTESGFYISSPSFISTNTQSSPRTVRVQVAQLNADGALSSTNQPVRAGLSVEVPVSSADIDIGQITLSPLVFDVGGSSRVTQFDPISAGNTSVSITQPAGFTAPTNGNQSIDAVVEEP